ncbi:MAG: hypothetical protein WB919_06265, partial [Candidatus Sulfotelmatobacter sp.]
SLCFVEQGPSDRPSEHRKVPALAPARHPDQKPVQVLMGCLVVQTLKVGRGSQPPYVLPQLELEKAFLR